MAQTDACIINQYHQRVYALLEKFWRILLYVTEDTIGKLYVT